MYEIFEHTADLGLRIRSARFDNLLEEAARALFSLFAVNLDQVSSVQERTYVIEGDQPDYLLLDWLSELLYTFETERLLFSRFEARFVDGRLSATCRGEAVDPLKHELHHEVKAITYHGLRVEQQADGWLAEVIVDI